MITVNNVYKTFDKPVLTGFSFIFDNEKYALMGESGIGKSTLLNILARIVEPDSGVITGAEGKTIGMVFQEDRLCENVSAIKNVALVTGKSRNEITSHLVRAGLTDSIDKPVKNLSGGMKRRVAIVRALINKPEIVILDEPLKGLDDKLKNEIIEYIKEMTDGATVLLVTHDKTEAQKLKAKIYTFNASGLSSVPE